MNEMMILTRPLESEQEEHIQNYEVHNRLEGAESLHKAFGSILRLDMTGLGFILLCGWPY